MVVLSSLCRGQTAGTTVDAGTHVGGPVFLLLLLLLLLRPLASLVSSSPPPRRATCTFTA
jgi:hypothetical protein